MRHLPHVPLSTSIAAMVVCSASFILPGRAAAIVSDVHPIDGPSAEVIDVADAAMSEDGTGGVVYLKRVNDYAHVFVAQFRGGSWGPAQRVDVGQAFDSSWARIGAGDGGRQVVTWVLVFGIESDRMFSATLDPGASGFQAPVPIDFNVGEATATYPDLAMARGGPAYLAYRVITNLSPANPPGYVGAPSRLPKPPQSALWQEKLKIENVPPSTYLEVATVLTGVCADRPGLLLSADDSGEGGENLLVAVSPKLRAAPPRVSDSIVATIEIAEDGALTLTGLAGDEGTKGADDAKTAQGDLKR
jgi:hypothetical protein